MHLVQILLSRAIKLASLSQVGFDTPVELVDYTRLGLGLLRIFVTLTVTISILVTVMGQCGIYVVE